MSFSYEICFTVLLMFQLLINCKKKKNAEPKSSASKSAPVAPPVNPVLEAAQFPDVKKEDDKKTDGTQDTMNEEYDKNVEKNSTVVKSVHV
ncbi:unnamed protein product [Caenorhabditis angaria]|uniref:Uncharacterized protein n=1 Tax=Caenorhabditis angaria TaxID=860376 RepID=A0A9P1N395_9PELO|nr:unnamed protein product [Caenorhabditis angaria]